MAETVTPQTETTPLLLDVTHMTTGGFLVTEIGPAWESVRFGVGWNLQEALIDWAEGREHGTD